MRATWLVLLVACGSPVAGPKKPSNAFAKSGGGAQVTAATLRERARTFCGAAYKQALEGGKGEGCEFTAIDKWRGAMHFEVEKDVPTRVRIELNGPADDAGAMRKRAVELVAGILDDAETAEVTKALDRLFGTTFVSDMSGHLGPLSVTAGTIFEPATPEVRGVVLDVATGGEGGRRPITEVPSTQFASPAKELPPTWSATAKAVCEDLATYVSKSHQVDHVEPKWTAGDLFVRCVHANENVVAQFVASWAPKTNKLLYLRAVAEVPQKRFAALIDKLLVPLLTPEQAKVAKTAAKKEPLDRKFDAQGLQMGSRHDSGGFYGETHEIEVSVQVGYGSETGDGGE